MINGSMGIGVIRPYLGVVGEEVRVTKHLRLADFHLSDTQQVFWPIHVY